MKTASENGRYRAEKEQEQKERKKEQKLMAAEDNDAKREEMRKEAVRAVDLNKKLAVEQKFHEQNFGCRHKTNRCKISCLKHQHCCFSSG